MAAATSARRTRRGAGRDRSGTRIRDPDPDWDWDPITSMGADGSVERTVPAGAAMAKRPRKTGTTYARALQAGIAVAGARAPGEP